MSLEILSIIQEVCEEKKISQSDVLEAVRQGIQKASLVLYPNKEVEVSIQSGSFNFQISSKKLYEKNDENNPNIKEIIEIDGSKYSIEHLPIPNINQNLAVSVRGIIMKAINNAEKKSQYENFKKKEGLISIGYIKQQSSSSFLVNIPGCGDAVLNKKDIVPSDTYQNGDKDLFLIKEVKEVEDNGYKNYSFNNYQAILDRKSGNFIIALLKYYIKEIASGEIMVNNNARYPGSLSKLTVSSTDPRVDPSYFVRNCLKNIRNRSDGINPFKNEKIFIYTHKENPVEMAKTIFENLRPVRIGYSEDGLSIDVVLSDEDVANAIGSKGSNVRIDSKLVGMNINIIPKSQYLETKKQRSEENINKLTENLDVDSKIAKILVDNDFENASAIANSDINKLIYLTSFSSSLAEEIKERAKEFIQIQMEKNREKVEKLQIEASLLELNGMTLEIAIKLAEAGINKVEKIANLSVDEVSEMKIIPSEKLTKEIVVNAKKIVYGNI